MSFLIWVIVGFLSVNTAYAERCKKELDEFIKHTPFKAWHPPLAEAEWTEESFSKQDEKKVKETLTQIQKIETALLNIREEEDKLWKAEKEKTEKEISNLGLNKEYSATVVALSEARKAYDKCMSDKECHWKVAANRGVDIQDSYIDDIAFNETTMDYKNHKPSRKDFDDFASIPTTNKKIKYPKEEKIVTTYLELDNKERALRKQLLFEAQSPKARALYKKIESLEGEKKKLISKRDLLFKSIKVNSNLHKKSDTLKAMCERCYYSKMVENADFNIRYQEVISSGLKPKAEISLERNNEYFTSVYNLDDNCRIYLDYSWGYAINYCTGDALGVGFDKEYFCELQKRGNTKNSIFQNIYKETNSIK
ncbi:MAG: hypothetical protein IPM57_07885 [Oligoflexia bacterium]|nr:hypothetical protein [Oligoflexia bacterium]